MTVIELSKLQGFSAAALPSPEREINGVYIGDLLSWVMGRANADNAWVTIMSNSNIVAVASLTDVSCVILAEGVILADDMLKLSDEKGINIIYSDMTAYEIASALSNNGI